MGGDTINTLEFLTELYGTLDNDYYMTLWSKTTKSTTWLSISDLQAIADQSIAMSASEDMFYGMGLASKPSDGRVTADEVVVLPCLWVDIDLRDERHSDAPETILDALKFVDGLPFEPSIIVKSGRGLHVYLVLREPFIIESAEDRKQLKEISAGFQKYVRDRAGFKIDATHDISRILRLPGTINHKYDVPETVEVIASSTARYNLSDFAEYAVEVSTNERTSKFKRNKSDKPAEVCISQCKFLQAVRDYPEQVTEPMWVTALSNIARCSDGPAACHEISKPYPKYSYNETEAKILHVLNDMSPLTCGYISSTLGFNQCPEGGCGVKSPCGFSLKKEPSSAPPDESSDKLLDEPIPSGFFEGEELPGIEKLTDLGNAERFAKMFRDKLLFCNDMGKWLIWNGKTWKPDGVLEIYQYAKKCIRSMYVLAGQVDDNDVRKAISKFANSSESLKNIKAMLSLAQSELPITMAQLDADKWALNVDNGVIDLRTGELKPHDPTSYNSKIASEEYNPDANAPVFTDFINSVFNYDIELISFMQRFLGYCLTGDTREQQFVIATGSGSNGKGTLLNLILDIMGDYAITTPTDTICKKNTEKISNDIARLSAARFVLMSETERGKRFDEALVKKMTGQDRMSARFLYKEDFEFTPQFKLCLMTNDKPQAHADDAALWRRIQLVPFTQKFEGAKADYELSDKLRTKEEKAGILNWMVKGCLEWQRTRLNPPESVKQATNDYRNESDTFQDWLDECCLIENDAVATSAELYQNFRVWSESNGIRSIVSNNIFGKKLKEKVDVESYRSGKLRKYKGIGLITVRHDNFQESPF
jgi:putative DNA primase/helicase